MLPATFLAVAKTGWLFAMTRYRLCEERSDAAVYVFKSRNSLFSRINTWIAALPAVARDDYIGDKSCFFNKIKK